MKELADLAFVDRATSHMGALEGCLKYLGIGVTPGWLYGSTGHAFILNIEDSLCGSGPHCWDWATVNRLGKNIGYRAQQVWTNVNQPDRAQAQQKAWDMVRKSIDDGFPCYGWHYDFMVIRGYDDNGYVLSGPNSKAPGDWQKFGMDAVGFLDVWSIRPGSASDDAKTVSEALSFAVSFGRKPEGNAGLPGYDHWAAGLESGKGDPFGGAYNAGIWAECRRFAVAFLEEASRRTGGTHAGSFQKAIVSYRQVSDNLDRVAQLFPYKGASKEQWAENMGDRQKRREAAQCLGKAKAAEAEGLEALAAVVAAMNPQAGQDSPR